MTDTTPDLLPCPFCGRAMEITDDLRHYNHPVSACFGRHISIAASDIDRIEMWNRSADLAAVRSEQARVLAMRDAGYDTPSLDPRDEVIARLVEALEFYAPRQVDGITFTGNDDAGVRARAALAAAKAVMK